MTFGQIAGVVINLFLYPYLIRILGKEVYGTYVFIFSNIQFFVLFVAAGFAMPALKKISLNADNLQIKSQTVSEVFTAKFILMSFCGLLLALLTVLIPFVQENAILYLIIFTMSIGDMFFPQWYFQGMQRMKFVTYVNLSVRLLVVPAVFIFVKTSADLLEYTLIASVLPFLGSVFSFIYLIVKDKIHIYFVPFKMLKPVFLDSFPFFWTTAFSKIKGESVKFFIGIFLGMDNVAVYDLANKIIYILYTFIGSINMAIFPKMIKDINQERIKRIFRHETLIGLSIVAFVFAFGYWMVLILGGKAMIDAYPLTAILSITIFTSLIVTCYTFFIFVPQNRYYLVTKTQIVSFVSFFVFAAIGLLIYKGILTFVVVFTLSNVAEVVFCWQVTKKYRLLI